MDLEELRVAWQRLDARLREQEAFGLTAMRELRLTQARHGLRPLFWGQVAQVSIGVPVMMLGANHWIENLHVPHQLASGLIVHAYGLAMVVLGGIALGMIARIDYSAPVTTIQRQLARLRWLYVRSSMVLGLSWWLLWLPFMMVLLGLVATELFASEPWWLVGNVVVGVLGLLATWAFHRWSHHPSRAALAQKLDDGAAGSSLTKTRALLDELARFERE